ncbi:alpha/beta fold hydrolase [Myxosarcina sp. GI1(2024)]
MQATSLATASSIPGNYWQWRGHSVYYVRAGEKSQQNPPLLLVHGFGASTDHWRKNLAGLRSQFEVWAIDLLGFGRSAKPDLEYSGNLWREQLHDFIDEVIGKSTILAGNSLGGYACLSVAAEYQQSVAGLILLNSAGPFTDTTDKAQKPLWQKAMGQATRSLLLQPWASYLLFQYLRRPSIIRRTLKQVYLDPSAITDSLVEDIYRPSCDIGAARVFNSVFKTPQGEKIDVLLAKMRCPLLMLWGESDPWINARARGVQFKKYYPQLTEYYLKAGHCPHDEIPEEVNQSIADWILSLDEQ